MISAVRFIVGVLGLVLCVHANGSILVTPASPHPGESVRLTLTNDFGFPATNEGATISRVGDRFVIVQRIGSQGCTLGSPSTTIALDFEIGTLAVGTYIVETHIVFDHHGVVLCARPQSVTSAAFVVRAAGIPTLSWGATIALIMTCGAGGILMLRGTR